MITGRVNNEITCYFPIIGNDGVTRVSGRAAECVHNLWYNGMTSLTPVVISEIGTTGEYYARFTPDAVGLWRLEITDPFGSIWAEDIGISDADIDLIWQYESGRWRIDHTTNEMIFYMQDGVTELMRYRLLDANGNPPVWPDLTAPFEREVL